VVVSIIAITTFFKSWRTKMMNEYKAQQMQLQRVIGELRVLKASYYDPTTYNRKGDDSREIMDFIENIVEDLKNRLG
jgi:hypothetical protein